MHARMCVCVCVCVFVTMGGVGQATTACEKLNAAAFQGRKLRVNMATSRRQ